MRARGGRVLAWLTGGMLRAMAGDEGGLLCTPLPTHSHSGPWNLSLLLRDA